MDTLETENISPKAEDPKLTAQVDAAERIRTKASIEAAVNQSLYYDGKFYWHQNEGRWVADVKETLMSNIRNEFNLKPIHADNVLWQIRKKARIDGTFPFIHNKSEVVYDTNGAFLNTAKSTLIAPAEEDGPFPWLTKFFANVWDPAFPEQKEVFLAWFQRLYKSAYEGNLQSGQALIIAGGVGLGKTLLSRKIIGAALGGFTDAGDILLGKTVFNKEAGEKAIWSVDDNRGGATWMKHSEFSNGLKSKVANPQMVYMPKYKDATTVTWRGRIIVTCNVDADSLSILPDMDDSINDKVMLFKLGEWKADFKNVEAVIIQELPYFLRWLINFKMTIPWEFENRFGPVSFHHPDLLRQSLSTAARGSVSQMLPIAIKVLRDQDVYKDEKTVWMSAVQVQQMLHNTDGISQICSNMFKGTASFGRALSKVGLPQILNERQNQGHKQYLINLEITE